MHCKLDSTEHVRFEQNANPVSISIFRGESKLVLGMTPVIAKRMRLHSADFRFKNVYKKFVGSRHCAAAFSLQVPKSSTDLDLTLLYISILRTNIKFVRKNQMLALGVCFPQPCSSDGHRFAVKITFESLPNDWFVSTRTNSME